MGNDTLSTISNNCLSLSECEEHYCQYSTVNCHHHFSKWHWATARGLGDRVGSAGTVVGCCRSEKTPLTSNTQGFRQAQSNTHEHHRQSLFYVTAAVPTTHTSNVWYGIPFTEHSTIVNISECRPRGSRS